MRVRPRVNVPGFTYECRTPDAAVAAASEWLLSERTMKTVYTVSGSTEQYWRSIGNWAMYDDTGTLIQEQFNYACHATLQFNYGKPVSCVAMWCAQGGHDEWKPFIDWLADDSFATEFVLAKVDTGIVVSADIPAGLLHAIAMISRAPRMFPKETFEKFNEVVSSGIYPEIAYMAVMNVVQGEDSHIWSPNDNHRAWLCPGLLGLKQFMSGKFEIPDNDLKFFRNYKSQYCSNFLVRGSLIQDLMKTDKDFTQALLDYRKSLRSPNEVYRPPNPFQKQAAAAREPRYGEVTRKEMYDFVLPYAQKKGYFDAEA